MTNTTQILFINKAKHQYSYPIVGYCTDSANKSSGLANSVVMVAETLNRNGIPSVVEEAIDNNCIDRLVTKHRPKFVIIEALWVVPEKFVILKKLHPTVTWIIRLHSEIPFLANEGIAFQWLKGYALQYPQVIIAANSKEAHSDLQSWLDVPVLYLPNYYKTDTIRSPIRSLKDTVNISCFGAIRPLKNQLIQAMAAIRFAEECGLYLKFHINGSRIEGRGESIYKNLVNLFADSKHELVIHPWYDHKTFKRIIRKNIDVGLQVSFTESYNIVAADHIDCGVPMVTSREVPFVASVFQAHPTSEDQIVDKIRFAIITRWARLHYINNIGLWYQNRKSLREWVRNFKVKKP